jgi:integrase
MRKIVEARVLGPYAEKDRWRIIILEKGVRRSEYLATLPEARKRMSQLKKQHGKAEAFTVGMMLEEYTKEREVLGKVLPLTSQMEAARIRDFLASILELRVSSVTSTIAARLYADLIASPNRRSGKLLSVATHRAYLIFAKALFNWAAKKGITGSSPFSEVTPVGKPNAGKTQLRIEEARRFVQVALNDYETHRRPMALAAVMALTMGLRASEILQRKVRDLDDDCGILWIDSGKTRNAKRHLRIPEFLRPHLRELVGNQSQDAYLFVSSLSGKPVRPPILWAAVQRLCLAAGVTAVCTHSLRGLYATLAVESGALSETVASSLGHGSFAMTEKHYAQASSVSNVRTARVDQLLTSGRAAEPMGVEVITQLVQKMSPQQREELMKAMSLLHQNALPSNP